MSDEDIDTSDIPPLSEEFFARAKLRMPKLPVKVSMPPLTLSVNPPVPVVVPVIVRLLVLECVSTMPVITTLLAKLVAEVPAPVIA